MLYRILKQLPKSANQTPIRSLGGMQARDDARERGSLRDGDARGSQDRGSLRSDDDIRASLERGNLRDGDAPVGPRSFSPSALSDSNQSEQEKISDNDKSSLSPVREPSYDADADTVTPAGSSLSSNSVLEGDGIIVMDAESEAMKAAWLDDFRLNKTNNTMSLKDVVLKGWIVELATDQYGSRFIQRRLEVAPADHKQAAFKQLLPKMLPLCTDVFGNYVIQKFFEYGTTEQRDALARKLVGNVLKLTMQVYGCRVVQKAIDVAETDTQLLLCQELRGMCMLLAVRCILCTFYALLSTMCLLHSTYCVVPCC
jgi:hypothetical protein